MSVERWPIDGHDDWGSASPRKRQRPGLNIITDVQDQSKRAASEPHLKNPVPTQRPQYKNRAATATNLVPRTFAQPGLQDGSSFVSLKDLRRLVDENVASKNGEGDKQRAGSVSSALPAEERPTLTRSQLSRGYNDQYNAPSYRTAAEAALVQRAIPEKDEDFFREISPSARTIVIGIDDQDIHEDYARQANDASMMRDGSQRTPNTPTIIITPAEENAPWHHQPDLRSRRPASSIYSQSTAFQQPFTAGRDAPPMPPMPTQHSLATMSRPPQPVPGRASMDSWDCSQSPTDDNDQHSPASDGSDQLILRKEAANTVTVRPRSKGWWNLISPILSRTNTLASRKTPTSAEPAPPLPTVGKTPVSAQDDTWKEELSPETPRRKGIGSSTISTWSRWSDWEHDRDLDGSVSDVGVGEDPEKDVQLLAEAPKELSPLSPPPMTGLAAEYFQACAHDLISPAPYFECINHSCADRLPALVTTTKDMELPVSDDIVHATKFLDKDKSLGLTGPQRSLETLAEESGPEEARSGSAEANNNRGRADSESTVIDDESADEGEVAQEKQSPRPDAKSVKGTPAAATTSQVTSEAAPEVTPTRPPPESAAGVPRQVTPPDSAPPPTAVPQYYSEAVNPQPAAGVSERATDQPGSLPSYSPPRRITRFPGPFTDTLEPASPGPISPAAARVLGPHNGIQMSEQSPPRPSPTFITNNYYTHLPPRPNAMPIGKPKAEDDGQEITTAPEKDDKPSKKSGCFGRVRKCVSKCGCLGRHPDPEGKKKRRWVVLVALGLLSIVIACIILATTLTRKGDNTPIESQWLNLTGYPPMPTGILTVAQPDSVKANSGCVHPDTMWSCALPKEEASTLSSGDPDQPNFRIEIRFRNGTVSNGTTVSNSTSKRDLREANTESKGLHDKLLKARDAFTDALYTSSPSPPALTEQAFLGNTTDNTTYPFEGEPTPFYITFLSPDASFTFSSPSSSKRSSSSNATTSLPNLNSSIPAPSTTTSGIAAPATLLPLPSSEPVRLYNRGLSTEHYGFYTYFDRTIFLSSLNDTSDAGASADQDGGSNQTDANFQCTWAQTRFLVRIWTSSSSGFTLLPALVSTASNSTSHKTKHSGNSTTSSATDFSRPGSMPYPVSVTLDRHGGAEKKKMLYCYSLENGQPVTDSGKIHEEFRSFGGTLVNPAPGLFSLEGDDDDNFDSSLGGIDGGTGGCGCEWNNFS